MINKVILLGNVGRDPEIRYFDNDQAVANFSIATTERAFKTRDGQEIPERTEWHNIVAWRGLAKLAENYIKKGTPLYVEGKLRTRTYDDANGVKKYATEIVADVIQLLGRKSDNDNNGNTGQQTSSQNTNPMPSQPKQPPANSNQNAAVKENDFLTDENGPEDDLPF
ncbi:MAG: single-stranded DNA-binding protein [Bacteroidales bacterium]|nr:single-stranded DNA-binding protein [Bacteroidales bacterium]